MLFLCKKREAFLRARLLWIIFGLAVLTVHSAGQVADLQRSDSEEEILKWGRTKYGSCEFKKAEIRDKQLFLLFGDSGSGVKRLTAYIYVYEHDEWKLLLVRYTGYTEINVEVRKDPAEVALVSGNGDTIVEVPYSSLSLDYNE